VRVVITLGGDGKPGVTAHAVHPSKRRSRAREPRHTNNGGGGGGGGGGEDGGSDGAPMLTTSAATPAMWSRAFLSGVLRALSALTAKRPRRVNGLRSIDTLRNVFESRRFLTVAQQAMLAGAKLRRRLAAPGDDNTRSASHASVSSSSSSASSPYSLSSSSSSSPSSSSSSSSPSAASSSSSSSSSVAAAAAAPRLVLRHSEAEACQRVIVTYFNLTRQYAESIRFFTPLIAVRVEVGNITHVTSLPSINHYSPRLCYQTRTYFILSFFLVFRLRCLWRVRTRVCVGLI
jgi:hypothetical protein